LQDSRGGRTLARTVDLSLSGVALSLVASPPEPHSVGETIHLYLKEVGHLPGHVARVTGDNVGIQFDLPQSIERDLLIRKLFTSGLDTTAVTTSMWSVTIGMLKRIWLVNSAAAPVAATANPLPPEEKLPAQNLVLAPLANPRKLSTLASERRTEAA
jgi:cellulose synthase (UDP-forming)